MSLKEKTMYTIKCDRCGEDAFSDHDITGWEEKWYPRSLAKATLGWIEHEGEDYCNNCTTWNKNESELIPVED